MLMEELMVLEDSKTRLEYINNGVAMFTNEVATLSFRVEEPIISVKMAQDDLYGFPVFCILNIWEYDSLESMRDDFDNAPWIGQYLMLHPELLDEFAKQQAEAEKNMEDGYIY